MLQMARSRWLEARGLCEASAVASMTSSEPTTTHDIYVAPAVAGVEERLQFDNRNDWKATMGTGNGSSLETGNEATGVLGRTIPLVLPLCTWGTTATAFPGFITDFWSTFVTFLAAGGQMMVIGYLVGTPGVAELSRASDLVAPAGMSFGFVIFCLLIAEAFGYTCSPIHFFFKHAQPFALLL